MRDVIGKLWTYLAVYKIRLAVIALSLLISTVTRILGPYYIGVGVDEYISTGDMPGLARLTAFLAAIFLTTTFFSWLQSHVMAGVAGEAMNRLRKDLFAKTQQLPLPFFDGNPHGELMSRFTNDVDNINATLSQGLVELAANASALVAVTAFMLFLHIQLALAILSATPLIIWTAGKIAAQTRRGFAEQQQSLAKANGFIEENIAGFKSIKAEGRGAEIARQFALENDRLRDTTLRAQILAGVIIPVVFGFNNVVLAVVIAYGAWLTIHGAATIGIVVAFINFARQFFHPLNQIAHLYNQLQLAVTGAERVFEVMAREAEPKDRPDSVAVKKLDGAVELRQVSFAYQPGRPVLKNIDLYAKPGQMIAFVGPTGCGKSTIINLLLRFYEIEEGQILFDGIDSRRLKIADLRGRIGVVLQDTVIFTATVRENIRYGRLEATDAEIETAAKLANVHDVIVRLPEKYETVLDGAGGGRLSTGQKQLIAIARTILSEPDILILDEATSNIDTRTEFKIQEAMRRMMRGRTSFVIAHRLKTILHADEIIVLRQGEIIERGAHRQLLAADGFYAELYRTQFCVD